MNQLLSIPSNPFATRRTRPGAIPYLFGDGLNVRELAERLRRQNWTGQIVGPHGSGKTTLLESLLPACASELTQIRRITLTDGRRKLPLSLHEVRGLGPGTLLVVDGYEQLSRLSRFWLSRQVRRRRFGLLVTAHKSVALPLLYQTQTTTKLTHAVVRQLADAENSGITDADIQSAHERHSGNLRETLFELYDLFQQRRNAFRRQRS